MSPRPLLITAIVCIAALAAAAAEFDVRNEAEFRKCIPQDAKVQKLAGGFAFVEGPCWTDAGGGVLIFSDIPNNKLIQWTKKDGIAVFRANSHNANGNARDREGRLVTCEHGSRSLTRTEADGSINTLIDKYDGKALNSPNDLAIKSDSTIWFTDPPYGIDRAKKEQAGNFVFRFDPRPLAGPRAPISAVAKDFDMPNGIAFSPDERKLYIADSGKPHHIRVFDVNDDGTLGGGKVLCVIDKGAPDGIRCDADGRVWSSAADGVHIYGADGALVGKVLVPESPANLCFGGEDGATLFITARTSLYAIKTLVTAPTRK